jgi:hypothetical protein
MRWLRAEVFGSSCFLLRYFGGIAQQVSQTFLLRNLGEGFGIVAFAPVADLAL